MLQRAITVHGIAISIPDDLFPQAEAIAARFSLTDSSTEIETVARFVEFSAAENADVAVTAFQHLHQAYCSADNIHVVVQQLNLSTEQARTVLKGYYSVWNILESRQLLPHVPVPAIFTDGNVRLAAMFGGQDGMSNYLDEAAWLLDVYRPLISDFVQHMSDFLKREVADPLLPEVHLFPLNIAGWLEFPESVPDAKYLLTSPVALPALGLVQAMHVAVLYKTLNMSPGDLLSHFKVAIGYSQGITMAAAFASVTDEASFYAATERALGILLATSAIVQLESSSSMSHAGAIGSTLSSEDPSSPMILVRGHSQDILQAFIAEFNAGRTDNGSRVSLALINDHSTFVVAGNPKPIAYFEKFLSKRTVLPTADQSDIRFSLRKPIAEVSPLSISAPYHCDLQLMNIPKILEFVADKGWVLHTDDLRIPINGGENGLITRDVPDLAKSLVGCMCVDVVDWPATARDANATHIVDFSPGGFSTFGKLARGAVEGTGTSAISASSLIAYSKSRMGSRADIYRQDIADVFSAPNWLDAYGPQLVRTTHDGQLHIRTPVSLALGLPPVMVAGMTPTTSNEHFVAAISNAGYHVELAGGGLHTEKNFCDSVDNLVKLLEPGHGFAVGLVYMNQKQWAFQYPAILRMCREGVPITGLSIGGDVPSVDVAKDIIADLCGAGIKHVAFKPNSLAAIRQALAIADANPDFPVVIQWAGGPTGGYYSFEDFHEPLLEVYGEIRSLPNTMLIVGSGFGDADSIIPYITGEWSVRLGRAPMPIDGVLLASCVMTAKESGASLEAKELVAATIGVHDSEQEDPYTGNASGVISVATGYGEVVHCVATRASLAIRDLNDMIFSKPPGDQLAIISANRDDIIKRLNDDYSRPWFGKKADGRVVDVEDMTYLEALNRFVGLTYVRNKSTWLDASYSRIFEEFVTRAEDRVSGMNRIRVYQRPCQLQYPYEIITTVCEMYPSIRDILVTLEDAQYLIWLCKCSDTKPVPFVPILDADLHDWMMRDITSVSEDLDAVVDKDVQRTVIALDSASAKYATTVNEPVKDILDRIYRNLVGKIFENSYNRDENLVHSLEYLAPEPSPISLPSSVVAVVGESAFRYQLPTDEAVLPDHGLWLELLAGPKQSWLHALLTTPVVLRGSLYATNPVRQILRPMVGQTAEVTLVDGVPTRLSIHGSTGLLDVSISADGANGILMTIFNLIGDDHFDVQFPFSYMPHAPAVLVAEDIKGRDGAYYKLLVEIYQLQGDSIDIESDNIHQRISDRTLESVTVSEDFVRNYCASVHNMSEYYKPSVDRAHLAPMDILFCLTTNRLTKILATPPLHKGLMGTIHIYHNMEYIRGAAPLRVGETIEYQLFLSGLENTDIGQNMTLTSKYYRAGALFAIAEDSMTVRNQYVSPSQMFRSVDEPVRRMQIISDEHSKVLGSLEWFVYRESPEQFKLASGDVLEFKLQSYYQFKSKDMYSSIRTSGPVYRLQEYGELQHIADIDFESVDTYDNPVIQYLDGNSLAITDSARFEKERMPIRFSEDANSTSVKAPSDNWKYAYASGDLNVIHTNPYIAAYAGEPQVICHGMWTSAATRAIVDRVVASGDPQRVRSYNVNFTGKVHQDDALQVQLVHSGMKDGYMLIEGQTVNQNGETVLTFTSEITQEKTAYVFTGQGSQFTGMGMNLYMASTIARNVWDRADKHMLAKYGVSLLRIVRDNPKEYLVKFTGKKGSAIRTNYLSLVREFNGNITQLLPTINRLSGTYTHRCETGLLNATLFTQPIQTVMSLAQAADMRSKGLIQEGAVFAGHSLGEFGSLAAIAEIVTVEDAVDIALYRGLLLHVSVERNGQGNSQYAMVAVNPKVVGNGFSITTLQEIVSLIRKHRQELLEVINHNVEGRQYVVTGHTNSLEAMRRVMDAIVAKQIPCDDSDSVSSVHGAVLNVLMGTFNVSHLTDGHGTTVIPGVDVPSHSSQMAESVDTFRNLLDQTIPHLARLPPSLCGRYIPNLSGQPFEITKDYFSHIHDITRSPVLDGVLQRWDADSEAPHSTSVSLARTLLIELLSYQFASSVNWVETQESMFKKCSIVRMIEIGPSATLCHMATQTLETDSWLCEAVTTLHSITDADDVYYRTQHGAVEVIEPAPLESAQASSSKPDTPVESIGLSPAIAEVQAPSLPAQTTSFVPVDDVPIEIIDILRLTVSKKLAKAISNVPPNKSIKELVAGKSMVQNELIGDLQKEFGKRLPDHAGDHPLEELAKSIGTFTNSLGKNSQSLIQKLFTGKLPGGFAQSVARSYLSNTYGLGPRRQDIILLMSVAMEPANRLADEEAAKTWLTSAVQMYAKHVGLSLTESAQTGSNANTGGTSVVINSAEFDKAQQKQKKLALEQMETLAKHAGFDIREGARSTEEFQLQVAALKSEIEDIKSEVGSEFIDKTKTMFDSNKARHFDSYWNWARQDVFEWISGILAGNAPEMDQATYAKRLHMLQNRSNPGLLRMLQAFMKTLEADTSLSAQQALEQAEAIYVACVGLENSDPVYKELSTPMQPHMEVTLKGDIITSEIPRLGETSIYDYIQSVKHRTKGGQPLLYLYGRIAGDSRSYDEEKSDEFYRSMEDVATNGRSFAGKYALVTGCGKGSIGSGLIEGLLSGGAKVVATTSNYSLASVRFFEDMYRKFGSRGSELVLVPFNQASANDVEALIQYIYSKDGLGWDLDYIAPFAAFPEHGKDAASVDSYSELTIRILLTNLFRIIRHVKAEKVKSGNTISPSLLILPHSVNNGTMGNDGMYSETKAALYTLYNRWFSESWSEFISITGGEIGWTRSTNMTFGSANMYASMEEIGFRTFSREEMAFNILCLLTSSMEDIAHSCPVLGNFNGIASYLDDMANELARRRQELTTTSNIRKAVYAEVCSSFSVEQKESIVDLRHMKAVVPLPKHRIESPAVKSYEQLEHLRYLEGMVDLDKVVVVTGFGEVGTFGNAALRWEQEAHGTFSMEGCIELAWMMGLIKRFSGEHPATESHYIGWVDAKTQEPVHDMDVKAKYEPYILGHTGIRVVEPKAWGHDPANFMPFMRELQIDHDISPFETTAEEAGNFKSANGDKVDTWENPDGTWSVKFLKGSLIHVPKTVDFGYTLISQLPSGWDPVRLGIPEDLARQMDEVNHYTLIAAVEALLKSGITDPYELYEYFHVSRVGHSVGSCSGGVESTLAMTRDRYLDRKVESDKVVESSTNNITSWLNTLLFSASGPLKPTTGACATTAIALDLAAESIVQGKADFMVTGAGEGYTNVLTYELSLFNATASARTEHAKGRHPTEISRPCTSSRSGFTESYGAGIAVLMSASAALKFGAPIYGIVAMSATASDKSSNNNTAPGQGILSIGKETPTPSDLQLLDIEYRRQMRDQQLAALDSLGNTDTANQMRKIVKSTWGNDFYKMGRSISPLRAALATWGLGADDIGLSSFHGTSTPLNDKNESNIVDMLMKHIGRTPGLPLPVVCQKWIIGHMKGASASCAVHGILQAMSSGLVPGNRNADNIDGDFEQYEYLVYPSKTIKVPTIKAAMHTSFGFSQSNGAALIVHPDYLFATLSKEELDGYRAKVDDRMKKSTRHLQGALLGNHTFLQPKMGAPFTAEQESSVFLDSNARAKFDPKTNEYTF